MGHVAYPVSAVRAVQEKSPHNIGYYVQVRVRIGANCYVIFGGLQYNSDSEFHT